MSLFVKFLGLGILTCIIALFLSGESIQANLKQFKRLIVETFSTQDEQIQSPSDTSKDVEIYNVISSLEDRLFSKEELAQYDGEEGSPGLYLGILGRVYDVESGRKYYGSGAGYGFFTGKDGTKAFMTGEFNEKGLIDETTGLTDGQMLELENWISFYDKTYIYKGKLIGNFYSAEGKPTEALLQVVEDIKVGHTKKREREAENKRFPPCNSQAKKGEYRRVFCSERSGGIKRDWAGVPRQYFRQGTDKPTCVCAQDSELGNPLLKPYADCDPNAKSCSLPPL